MKKLSYIMLLTAVGLGSTACKEKQEYFEMGTLDGIGMVTRGVSVEDGATIRPIDYITVDYNNLIGLNENKPATLNGTVINAYVNPENRLQLVLPISCEYNTDYTLVIPDGYVYRSDDASVTNEGLSVSFNTKVGTNPSSVDSNLTNANATPEAKALYAELLSNYGKVMYSGAMGGVGWETDFTDYIAANNGNAGYPKIVGFDYIHLASSPSNWIDYGDITPVQTIWNAGSIPAITWHWNIPEIKTGALYPFSEEDGVIDMGGWSDNLQIPASYFSLAQVGNKITVNVAEASDNAQGSFKDGASWAGLVDADGTNYEYFELNTTDEEGNTVYGKSFSLTLSPTLLEAVKANGLIISGQYYILKNVEFDGYFQGGNGLSYNNSFSPILAVTLGTPHNDIVNADIAKLAGYMKLLQDANIPVLFRPFHEAAGDYTYGSWFWWGSDGVEATIQLWKYLRNKLQNEYGLNNLIWVWTAQTSDGGNMADVELIRSAYPGDDVVDIIGTDLYPDNAYTDQTAQFDIVNAVVEGKKMVALTEVGNLVDPDAAAANNALWSYFMNWYDMAEDGSYGFNIWNYQPLSIGDNSYSNVWEAVCNNPIVINR